MTDAFVEVDPPEQSKEEKETASSTAPKMFWKLEYYQQFFNVTTNDVGQRIFSSMVPNRKGFIDVIAGNPDLYGPLWVCVTLIVTASMSGNIAKYFGSRGQSNWTFHFEEVTSLATILFIYTWIVPVLLWGVLAWRVGQANTHSLLSMITLYGYSLSIYIPVSVLWTVLIHFSYLQWIITLTAALLSGGVLAISFWPVIKKDRQRIAYGVIGAILVLHLILGVGFQLYFFRSVSSSPLPRTQLVAPVNDIKDIISSPNDVIDSVIGEDKSNGDAKPDDNSSGDGPGQKDATNHVPKSTENDDKVDVDQGDKLSTQIKLPKRPKMPSNTDKETDQEDKDD